MFWPSVLKVRLGGAILISRSERYEPRGRPNSRWLFSAPDLRKRSRVGREYRDTSRVTRGRLLALRREGACGLTLNVPPDGDLDLRLALQRVARSARVAELYNLQKNVPRYLNVDTTTVNLGGSTCEFVWSMNHKKSTFPSKLHRNARLLSYAISDSYVDSVSGMFKAIRNTFSETANLCVSRAERGC